MGCGSSSQKDGEDLVGSRHNFTWHKNLGKGASCVVQKVSDENGNFYALKKVFMESDLGDEEDTRQFYNNECHVLRAVNHPHVISLVDSWEEKNYFNILMPLCTGGQLYERITKTKHNFTEKTASKFSRIMMVALLECHKKNVVHRDLKPENFVLKDESENADLLLIDFGCARYGDPGDVVDDMAGTPYYVAPEVLKDEEFSRTIEQWKNSDVWSLGVVIYLMLVGWPPFLGENVVEIFANITKERLRFPISSELSDEAKDLIRQMLNKNEQERPNLEELLKHPWIVAAEDRLLAEEALNGLESWVENCQLKKAVAAMLASEMQPHHEERLEKIFHNYDKDGDQRLGPAEIAEFLRSMGHPNRTVKQILNSADSDNDGAIQLNEFVNAEAAVSLSDKNVMKDAFVKIDKDHDGTVSMSELMECLHVDQDTIESWLSEVGHDKDSKISFQEWISAMSNTPVHKMKEHKQNSKKKQTNN